MFVDVKPHSAYAETGDWVRSLPSHWGWLPAHTLFQERKSTGYADEPLLSVTIGRGVIPQRELLASTSNKDSSNEDKTKYKLVLPGDLVYNKMRAWQGAAGLASYRGIVSPAYVVMTPRTGDVGFFHHIVRSPMFAREAERWSYGISSDQWSLRPEHFKMIRLPVPPADEQAAIVKYLAHANVRIDKAIAAKRRLIALLLEHQCSLGAELLAGGLPRPDADGDKIPWYGQIPAHWRSARLRQVARIFSGSTPDRGEREYWHPGEAPWVSSGKVGDLRVQIPSEYISHRAVVECSLQLAAAGAVIVGLVGQGRTRGASALLEIDTYINQNLAALVPGREISSEYLWLALKVGYLELRSLGRGGNQAALNADLVGSFPIPIPPREEQGVIVSRFEEAVAQIRQARDRADSEIKLLAEFRRRLIADVVTGQVDVREIAATLPDVDLSVVGSESDPEGADDETDFDDVTNMSED